MARTDYYTRQVPRDSGGSYTPPETDGPEGTEPRKFVLKEKIGEMMKYGLPLVNNFPRKDRKMADILRESMMEMYRLAVRLERRYYKKTTLEDIEEEIAKAHDRYIALIGADELPDITAEEGNDHD